jgi:hypothetical protein
MSDRYERSARFWLRAYPQRWRDAHGDEAFAVLLDLASPGPDGGRPPRWVGAREAWGLVQAGWGLRWRGHPPLGRWLLYRLLDVRLPARYWWWVADDIQGALYTVRSAIGVSSLVAALWTVPLIVGLVEQVDLRLGPGWTLFWWTLAVATLLHATTFRRTRVRKAWQRHVLDGDVPVDRSRAERA